MLFSLSAYTVHATEDLRGNEVQRIAVVVVIVVVDDHSHFQRTLSTQPKTYGNVTKVKPSIDPSATYHLGDTPLSLSVPLAIHVRTSFLEF